jgi:hypothetical protein
VVCFGISGCDLEGRVLMCMMLGNLEFAQFC